MTPEQKSKIVNLGQFFTKECPLVVPLHVAREYRRQLGEDMPPWILVDAPLPLVERA